jgi:ATP-dependent helicase/nuclease subunit B
MYSFFKILTPQDWVITVNKRLVFVLQDEYRRHQMDHGQRLWKKPNISTFEDWLVFTWEKHLIHGLVPTRILLSDAQELLIWRLIIQNSSLPIVNLQTTILTAQQAWKLYRQWRLEAHEMAFEYEQDTQIWHRWAKQFQQLCQQKGWLDRASLINQLLSIQPDPVKRIFLIGFDEITPQQQQWLKHLNAQVIEIKHKESVHTHKRIACNTTDDELTLMLRWACTQWRKGSRKIACIVPNLVRLRTKIQTIFDRLVFNDHPKPNINLSMGSPLCEHLLIHTALLILQLQHKVPVATIIALLHSPYCLDPTQYDQQAQLARTLNDADETNITLQQLTLLAQTQGCSQFAHVCHQLHVLLTTEPHVQTTERWILLFLKTLNLFYWPGNNIDAIEAQWIARWDQLLDELIQLDHLFAPMTKTVVLNHLYQIASNTIFQPSSPSEAIQVLGMLETAGRCFEHLWIQGLDNQAWPPSAQPNPFIPYALQASYGLPHAHASRELYFAQLLTQRLKISAPQVIFSYAHQQDDQTHQASRLIESIQELKELPLATWRDPLTQLQQSADWAWIVDTKGPAITETTSVHSQLYRLQAACPFRAFTYYRLGIRATSVKTFGLSPSERGKLLHHCLEILWKKIKNQATLIAYTATQLKQQVDRAIERALNHLARRHPKLSQPQFRNLESTRLSQLITHAINLDKMRPAFQVIALEKKTKKHIGLIQINLRLDRIDQLDHLDNQWLVIDYKTGGIESYDWLDPRMDEPQLPLYILTHPKITAALIMHIHSRILKTQGISQKDIQIKQVVPLHQLKNAPETWAKLLDRWQKQIIQLTQEFQSGYAQVMPKHGAQTCRYCDLKLFCRINNDGFVKQ